MLEISEKFRNISMSELIRSGYTVKFAKFNSQRVFLIDNRGRLDNIPKQFPVYVHVKKKTPMGKRILDAEMGKISPIYTNTKVFEYVVILKDPKVGTFPAYEVVR